MSIRLRPSLPPSLPPAVRTGAKAATAPASGPAGVSRSQAPVAAHRAAAAQAASLRAQDATPYERLASELADAHPKNRALWAPLYKLLGKGSADLGGWALREGAPTRDVTAGFNDVYAAVKTGAPVLPPDAGDYAYLTVQGFLGGTMPTYMDGNVKRLRERGLDVSEVAIQTQAGVEVNAAHVRDAILEASRGGRKVVLLGHSKGGLDITAALSLYPELKQHVRAVATLQTPFGGSPLASDLSGVGPLRWLAGGLLEKLNGSGDSLRDLTYEQRQKFLDAHPYPSDIPTVSLASSDLSVKSVLHTTARYMMDRYGWASDGAVPTQDQIIPGSDVIHVYGLDHAEAALEGPGVLMNHQPGDLTEALVAMALQTAQPAWMATPEAAAS